MSSRGPHRPSRALAVGAVAVLLAAGCAATPAPNAPSPGVAVPAPRSPAPEPRLPPPVDPAAAVDRELAARVERALAADPALRDAVIEAEARAGQVTLTGTVPTFREQTRAIEAALAVPGVKSVRPRLVLQPP